MPGIDLTGQVFERLTVLSRNSTATTAEYSWWCHCSCGNTVSVRGNMLRKRRTKSCGCLRHKPPGNFVDITGQTFTRLTVTARDWSIPTEKGAAWVCTCVCGNTITVLTKDLNKKVKSCGCLKRTNLPERNLKHGATQKKAPTPEYKTWQKMKERCLSPTSKDYARYGGRGITICQRWKEDFSVFLEDMGLRPTPQHSLERRDNNGPYAPENCRWATKREQARNTRNNVLLTWNGETHCISEWSEIVHISQLTLAERYRAGWSVERVLTTPVRRWPSQRRNDQPSFL